jgi:hypothetical protein
MKERPILFSAPMVRAILEGRKTMTRRIVKPQPRTEVRSGAVGHWSISPDVREYKCPFGDHGDRLWCRESMRFDPDQGWRYEADGTNIVNQDYRKSTPFCPSIHMPRRASRITLEITGIRVERLNKISEADAIAEGIFPYAIYGGKVASWKGHEGMDASHEYPSNAFRDLWEKINGPGSWAKNPWVWVIAFRRVDDPA